MKRILVCGSRRWRNVDTIRHTLGNIPRDRVLVIGGAKGADAIAESVAAMLGFVTEIHPADWEKNGKRAGVLRNREMLDSQVDAVLAFLAVGPSPGTADTVGEAIRRGIRVKLVYERLS